MKILTWNGEEVTYEKLLSLLDEKFNAGFIAGNKSISPKGQKLRWEGNIGGDPNNPFTKYFKNGLLIGERKEKITTIRPEPKRVFMTDEELTCLRCKYLTVGIIIFAIAVWLIMLLFKGVN